MNHPLSSRFPERPGALSVFFHPDCLLHEGPPGHPESPGRLAAILEGCRELPPETAVAFVIPSPATFAQLLVAHDRDYLLRLEEAAQHRSYFMSPDNYLCPDSFDAIRAAAGCAMAAGRRLTGRGASFALTRPPGHHAGRATAEGFCFINHTALAIETIRQTQPDARFLVVDFDVHHGNGIDRFYHRDPRVFYCSIHGNPDHIYPHSGFPDETGRDAGLGFTRNATVEEGTGGEEWLEQFNQLLTGATSAFTPDHLLVSAGFDAHEEDPFGLMKLRDEHFLEMTGLLRALAADHCSGRAAWFLEGGYSSRVLKRLVPRVIAELAGASGAENL